jgi:hypothetical protein
MMNEIFTKIAEKLKEKGISMFDFQDGKKHKRPSAVYKNSDHDITAWSKPMMNDQEIWLFMNFQGSDSEFDLFLESVKQIEFDEFILECFSVYPHPIWDGLKQFKYKIQYKGV